MLPRLIDPLFYSSVFIGHVGCFKEQGLAATKGARRATVVAAPKCSGAPAPVGRRHALWPKTRKVPQKGGTRSMDRVAKTSPAAFSQALFSIEGGVGPIGRFGAFWRYHRLSQEVPLWKPRLDQLSSNSHLRLSVGQTIDVKLQQRAARTHQPLVDRLLSSAGHGRQPSRTSLRPPPGCIFLNLTL